MTSESKHKIIANSIVFMLIVGLELWAPFHGHMPLKFKIPFYVLVALGLILMVSDAIRNKRRKLDKTN